MSVSPIAHGSGDAGDRVGLVHAIEAADECGFAAARGADQSRGVVRRDLQVDVLQSVVGAIPRIQI